MGRSPQAFGAWEADAPGSPTCSEKSSYRLGPEDVSGPGTHGAEGAAQRGWLALTGPWLGGPDVSREGQTPAENLLLPQGSRAHIRGGGSHAPQGRAGAL